MMEWLFWSSAALIAYVYAGYPALLAVWARLAGRRGERGRGDTHHAAPRYEPGVTIVIAARNEGQRLPGRIENLLASDYPADRMQIIVASDGSTDNTAESLAPYRDRVRLLMLPASGKAGALNAAVREADYPILVFADARQRFAPDAIRRLAAHFDNPEIGAVSGELVLDCERPDLTVDVHPTEVAGSSHSSANGNRAYGSEAGAGPGTASTIGDGVGAYWAYEKWLRRHEALVGSSVGVTGAIYAMRRWLWRPLPVDTILDDVVTPMRVVLRGYRVSFDEHARAYDEAAKDAPSELRRKTRTLAGNFQLLAREPRLLLPFVNPVWVQFVSHKVGRLLVPYALLAVLVASAVLAPRSPVYAVALAAQALFYALAAYGAALDRRARQVPVATSEVYREAA
jgi:poly-beta-1,6-N-acetyl-D-glucosamine synthase